VWQRVALCCNVYVDACLWLFVGVCGCLWVSFATWLCICKISSLLYVDAYVYVVVCVAVCCNVLHCVAVYGSLMQFVAVCMFAGVCGCLWVFVGVGR